MRAAIEATTVIQELRILNYFAQSSNSNRIWLHSLLVKYFSYYRFITQSMNRKEWEKRETEFNSPFLSNKGKIYRIFGLSWNSCMSSEARDRVNMSSWNKTGSTLEQFFFLFCFFAFFETFRFFCSFHRRPNIWPINLLMLKIYSFYVLQINICDHDKNTFTAIRFDDPIKMTDGQLNKI